MNNRPPQSTFHPRRLLRKLFLSAFVVISFAAYALQRPFTNNNPGLAALPPTSAPQEPASTAIPTAPPPTSAPVTNQPNFVPDIATPVPTDIPTIAPPTTAGSSGLYKDGTYTGSQADAFYGLVEVQTVIQHGKIADVQFLEYPSDRRTSVRINDFAMPYLQQEAIQAQSANVDLIGGATLTSQAFIESLQTALDKAKA
jgi:uncharacterized protein with FMN-binding domain